MTDLPHIAARIFGTPLVIEHSRAEEVARALGPRLLGLGSAGEPPRPVVAVPGAVATRKPFEITDQGVAVIAVTGTLVHRAAAAMQPASGALTAYTDIEAQVLDAATDPQVRAILLDIDTPGGEANGVFDLANTIREAAEVKPLWAVADEWALSGGYAIACAASRVVLPQKGAVGSVGVLALHLDVSDQDKAEGLRFTTVFAGARKNDFNPHEPLSEEALGVLQAAVDRTYELFVAGVARHRGLTKAGVRQTQAAIYEGEQALAVGFADAVMPFREALAELTETINGRAMGLTRPSSAASAAHNPPRTKETIMSETGRTVRAPGGGAGGASMDYAAACDIAAMCATAGQPEMTARLLAASLTPDQARPLILNAQAAASGPELSSAVQPATEASAWPNGEAPVVTACKALAAQSQRHRQA